MGSFLWRITTLIGIVVLSLSAVAIVLPFYKTESISKNGKVFRENRYYINYYEIEKTDLISDNGAMTKLITRNYYENLQLVHHTLSICFYFLVLGMAFNFVNLIVLIFLGKKTMNKTIAILVTNIFSAILYFISCFMALQITEDFRNSQDQVVATCKNTFCVSFFGRSFNSYKTLEYKWRPDLGWIFVAIAMGLTIFQLIPVVISTVIVFKKNKTTKTWKEIIEDAQLKN